MSRKPAAPQISAPDPNDPQVKARTEFPPVSGSWLFQKDGSVLPGDQATADRLRAWLDATEKKEA